MIRIPVLCVACVRFRSDGRTCDAFPRGIPDDIVRYGGDHTVPVTGDRGLQFKSGFDQTSRAQFEEWQASHR